MSDHSDNNNPETPAITGASSIDPAAPDPVPTVESGSAPPGFSKTMKHIDWRVLTKEII